MYLTTTLKAWLEDDLLRICHSRNGLYVCLKSPKRRYVLDEGVCNALISNSFKWGVWVHKVTKGLLGHRVWNWLNPEQGPSASEHLVLIMSQHSSCSIVGKSPREIIFGTDGVLMGILSTQMGCAQEDRYG